MARKSRTPIDMSTVLTSSSGTLAQIKAKTNSLAIMADIVRQICPDLPEDAFNIANLQQNTLVIEVKSPIWGQRLQFERNNICVALREQTDNQFHKIVIKVNPHAHRQAAQREKSSLNIEKNKAQANASINNLSSETAKQLLDVASSAPKGLKEKLEKLARAADRKNR